MVEVPVVDGAEATEAEDMGAGMVEAKEEEVKAVATVEAAREGARVVEDWAREAAMVAGARAVMEGLGEGGGGWGGNDGGGGGADGAISRLEHTTVTSSTAISRFTSCGRRGGCWCHGTKGVASRTGAK